MPQGTTARLSGGGGRAALVREWRGTVEGAAPEVAQGLHYPMSVVQRLRSLGWQILVTGCSESSYSIRTSGLRSCDLLQNQGSQESAFVVSTLEATKLHAELGCASRGRDEQLRD